MACYSNWVQWYVIHHCNAFVLVRYFVEKWTYKFSLMIKEENVSVNSDHQVNWLSQAVVFYLNKWKAWLEPRTNQGCPPGVQCCAYKRKGQSPKVGGWTTAKNLALSVQSTRTLQHQEGFSHALRRLQEEEKNRGIRGDGSSRSMVWDSNPSTVCGSLFG